MVEFYNINQRRYGNGAKFLNSEGFAFGLLTTFLLLCILSNISIIVVPTGEGGIKMHHAILPILFVYCISIAGFPKISVQIYMLFASIAVTSLLAYQSFGVPLRAINVVYATFVFFGCASAATLLGQKEVLRAAQIAWAVALCAVLIKNAILFQEISSQLSSGYRVFVYGLVGGGPNQEAGILTLGAVLFLRNKYFWPYFLASSLIGVIYISRGAILTSAIVMVIYTAVNSKVLVSLFVAILVSLPAYVAVSSYGTVQTGIYVIDRATQRFSSSDDGGNLGRLLLYEGAEIALDQNLTGYGAMNAMPVIERNTGIDFIEDNLHNIYLQMLVDGGVHTLVLFLLVAAMMIHRSYLSGGRDNILLFISVYLVIGFIRFRGYDFFAYGMIGMSDALWNLRSKSTKIQS